MKESRRKNLCVLCALCGVIALLCYLPTAAVAGGYAQGFQGSQSAGMSGAVTARPNMPEAGFYNPAGFALQDEFGASLGAAALVPQVIYEDPRTGERTRAQVSGAFPPYLHGYWRQGSISLGLSLGVPYGAGLEWPEDWPGRFEVTSTSLTVYEAAPSLAWRPITWLAIGGGPRIAYGQVGFERFIDFAQPGDEGFVNLSAGAFGMGGQVGAWAQVHDLWSLGLSWRSAMTLAFEGLARFENIPEEMEDRAHDTIARTEMDLPHRLVAGVAFEVGAMGTISLDLEYTLWGVVDTFEVRFDSEDVEDILEARDWENTLAMRVGAEYLMPINGLTLRTGFAIDPSPAPEDTLSPATPDTDRYITSLGLGYQAMEFMDVDLSYTFITLSRTASTGDFPGVYDGQIHAFTLGLRWSAW